MGNGQNKAPDICRGSGLADAANGLGEATFQNTDDAQDARTQRLA